MPSPLQALGEVAGEMSIDLRISLKVGLPSGSICSIFEIILCIFLEISISLGKNNGFFLISLLRELIDLEDQGQKPTRVS